ncbi:MAG: hypothetical protein B0A82_17760 [Alkalinema sp. CACIAM 70d]|nr:MAG: hypothetical protein B0A82_17760 [Alkalinema sp. CACIAM 70d]
MIRIQQLALASTAITLASLGVGNVAQAASIVINGGFEDPALSTDGSFLIQNPIPGWTQTGGVAGAGIEIQRRAAGDPYEGKQLTELDGKSVTEISQDLATVIGQVYKLKFAFSARPENWPPNSGNATPGGASKLSIMNVSWGGTLIDTLTKDGTGLSNTDWSVYTYFLKATSKTTRLSFGNLTEPSDSYGSYLDDVNVTAVPTPALLPGLVGMGIGLFRKRKNQLDAVAK